MVVLTSLCSDAWSLDVDVLRSVCSASNKLCEGFQQPRRCAQAQSTFQKDQTRTHLLNSERTAHVISRQRNHCRAPSKPNIQYF